MTIPSTFDIKRSIQERIRTIREKQHVERHGLRLVSCRANKALSQEIADLLEEPLLDVEIKDHADGEPYVRLHQSVREEDVFVLQSTCPPVLNNFGELFIVNDAVSRSSPHRLVNIIPYCGFLRQDRKTSGREAITAKLFANLLEKFGKGELKKIFIFEPHFPQLPGYFNTPKVDIGFATPIFLAWIRELQQQIGEDSIVPVSPDVGGVARVRVYAKTLRKSYAVVDKWRPEHGKVEVINVIGDVEGKTAVIIDDMIDTGGTICEVSEALINRGAREVYVLATHALLTGSAVARLMASPMKRIVTTNTVPVPPEKMFDKLEVLSVSSLLASFILNIFLGEPISPLLGYDD